MFSNRPAFTWPRISVTPRFPTTSTDHILLGFNCLSNEQLFFFFFCYEFVRIVILRSLNMQNFATRNVRSSEKFGERKIYQFLNENWRQSKRAGTKEAERGVSGVSKKKKKLDSIQCGNGSLEIRWKARTCKKGTFWADFRIKNLATNTKSGSYLFSVKKF